MLTYKRTKILFAILFTASLGMIAYLTSIKLTKQTPVAPTVPQATPQAQTPECTFAFTLYVSPTPTPSEIPTQTPTPTQTSTPIPSPTPNPVCGAQCGFETGTCTSDLTCSSGTCVLPYCIDNSTLCDATRCNILPTPTITPIPGQCLAIRIYDTLGNEISQALLNQTANVGQGDTIILAVSGTNATKARFRVNGIPSTYNETTTQNNQDEFIYEFTVPQNLNQFTVEAEVFIGGEWR